MLRSQFKSIILVIFALVAPATEVAKLLIFVTEQCSDVIVHFLEKGSIFEFSLFFSVWILVVWGVVRSIKIGGHNNNCSCQVSVP